MVNIFSSKDRQLIQDATKQAEQKTNAHIVTIVLPASDTYLSYMMLLGWVFASLLGIFLWQGNIITYFPMLLCIQLIMAILFPFIPGMKKLTLKLLPKKLYHHRAAQMAAEKRLAASKNVNSSKAVLVLFISLAEHYIHIFPNAVIRENVPNVQWDNIVRELIHSLSKTSLGNACVIAIEECGNVLLRHNPS